MTTQGSGVNYLAGYEQAVRLCSNSWMTDITESLGKQLKQARQHQRWSQLALSLHLGVSQRHISFVESGRASPSRTLLVNWLEALSLPMVQRNALLQLAGFAAQFSATPLQDSSLEQVRSALSHLLESHAPHPALVIGAQWDLLQLNSGAQWLAETLMPELFATPKISPNMLDLLLHPQGLMRHVINREEVSADFLAQLSRDLVGQPELEAQMHALEKKFGLNQSSCIPVVSASSPLLTIRFMTAYGELAFFRMFSTFGSPRDITLDSMRVEHMFAADDHTRLVLEKNVIARSPHVA